MFWQICTNSTLLLARGKYEQLNFLHTTMQTKRRSAFARKNSWEIYSQGEIMVGVLINNWVLLLMACGKLNCGIRWICDNY